MIDVSELEAFARSCEAARADLKPYAGRTLDEIGKNSLILFRKKLWRRTM